MATLDSGFEDALQDAVLDDAEAKLVGDEANYVFEFVELVHTRLRAYGQRHGYDVESTIDSLGTPTVDRRSNTVTVTVGWESPQMSRWEFGTSPHTIRGDPLSFVWHNPPEWVKREFNQERSATGQFAAGWRVFLPSVDHPGLPQSRAIRDSLEGLRQVLQS